jgi:hypothetical protein
VVEALAGTRLRGHALYHYAKGGTGKHQLQKITVVIVAIISRHL